MKTVETRIVEVKYTGSIEDYTLRDLEMMAWVQMEKRGDFSPTEEDVTSDEEAKKMDGKVWIDKLFPSNHMVHVGMSNIADEEE